MTERAALRIVLDYVHAEPVSAEQVHAAIGAVIAAYDRRNLDPTCHGTPRPRHR